MANRLVTPALRGFGRRYGRSAIGSQRHFSSTPVHGVRAIFAETGHAELDDTLKHIQEMIILPAYLPAKQRKLVFSPNKANELEKNPVIIEVEGYEHRFASINRFKDIRNSKDVFQKALEEMQRAGDWQNLGTLLAGYKKASIKLQHRHERRMIGVAGTSGSIYSIIECAKQADQTGLILQSPDSVAQVLVFVNAKIASSNWGAEETKQALRATDIVLDMVQRAQADKPWVASHGMPTPPQFSLLVRGLALFARSSAFAAMQQGDEAATNNDKELLLLKDEVELLGSLWTRALRQGKDEDVEKDIDILKIPEFVALCPHDVIDRKNQPNGLNLSKRSYTEIVMQVMKGIELAEEATGGEVGVLSSVKEALDRHLKTYAEESRHYRNSWAENYELIMGRKPDWPGAAEKV